MRAVAKGKSGLTPISVAKGENALVSDTILKPRSGHRAVRVGDDGTAWIEGYHCGDCQAAMLEASVACRSCGSRDNLSSFRAAQTGKVYSWTVVHRSYPGIPVPFVSAVVDLDGGLTLKGTLRSAEPAAICAGLPVRLVFDDAGGACDSQGAPYVGFHFLPEGASQ
jgi:uncharacterized protein